MGMVELKAFLDALIPFYPAGIPVRGSAAATTPELASKSPIDNAYHSGQAELQGDGSSGLLIVRRQLANESEEAAASTLLRTAIEQGLRLPLQSVSVWVLKSHTDLPPLPKMGFVPRVVLVCGKAIDSTQLEEKFARVRFTEGLKAVTEDENSKRIFWRDLKWALGELGITRQRA